MRKVCVHEHVQACMHMYGLETLAAGEAPERPSWLLQLQWGLIWHLEPWGLGRKSGDSPSPPQTLQAAGSRAWVVFWPLKLKSQDTSVTEDKG